MGKDVGVEERDQWGKKRKKKKRKKIGLMSPLAQHKLFIHFKRINCKTVESYHISIYTETGAYHAYMSTKTASAALSTGYFSLGWQLITMFKQRKIKGNPMQNLKCLLIDLKAMKRIQPTVQHHSLVSLEEEKS